MYSIIRKKSAARKVKNRIKLLSGRRPLRRGIVTKAVLRSPKKPHSGKRATVKFHVPRFKKMKNYAYIMAQDGRRRMKKYDVIFFRGGRRRDIPAMKYTAVYGVRTKRGGKHSSLRGLTEEINNARSKYGAKRPTARG
jgi:small subunit ribosomal protein S12